VPGLRSQKYRTQLNLDDQISNRNQRPNYQCEERSKKRRKRTEACVSWNISICRGAQRAPGRIQRGFLFKYKEERLTSGIEGGLLFAGRGGGYAVQNSFL